MSRSYRKPWMVDTYGSRYKRFFKRYANKVVRKATNFPEHMGYKRVFNSWDIVDWKYYEDWKLHWCNYTQEWYEPTPKWKCIRK